MEKDKILQALRTVNDPQSGQDLVLKNMVQSVEVDGNSINITLDIPSLQTAQKAEMNFACTEAVLKAYPEANVNIHFMMQAASPTPPQGASDLKIKNVIAVASGKGGVGKSTVSVNLALGLQKLGARVGLMDADVYGPSIPTMLGLQGRRPPVRDTPGGAMKMEPLDAYGMPVISIGNIIDPEQAVVLRGPRLAGIIKQFINDVLWGDLDFLIVDLPPGTGDVQLTLVQTVPVTGVVLVTTPQEVAIADATKAMNMFRLPQIDVPILGVVENMSWFTPAELPDNKYFLFGEGGGKKMAQLSNSILLGQVPIVQSVREGGDTGVPIVLQNDQPVSKAFLKVAENTLRQVAVRNETMGPTQQVRVD